MSFVEITFLGTGTTIPTIKRRHPSVHLKYQSRNNYSMLFDCGEGTQIQLQKAKINFMSIDYIFISHWHADHWIGLFGLLTSMAFEGRKNEIIIVAPNANKIGPELLKFFHLSFKIKFVDCREGKILEEEEFLIEGIKGKHSTTNFAYRFQEKEKLKLDKKKIKKLKLNWKDCREIKEKGKIRKDKKLIKLEDVSYTVPGRKVVYSGDTKYIKKMEEFSKDSILIHECTYFSKEDLEDKNHSTLEDVLNLRKFAKKIYLTHISRKYTNHRELESKVKRYNNVVVAKDLKKVKI